MRYGLRIPSFSLGPKTAGLQEMGSYLRRAEDLGFDSAVSMDLDYWKTYYLLGEAAEVADRISARIAALDGGVDTIVLNPLDWSLEQLELIAGEVLPRVKGRR